MSVQPACAPIIARRSRLASARVLTIGGASVEHSYAIPGELEPDTKYTTAPQPRRAGGSSVNHACRLLAMGVDVHAVVPLAKADPLSAVIVRALDDAEQTSQSSYRRSDLFVRGADLTTPYTTIIRQNGSRAALNEFAPALMERFGEHLDRHLAALDGARRPPDLVAIGHVHADRRKSGPGDPGREGSLTEKVLRRKSLARSRRFVNFGSAQYELGTKRWASLLRDHVDVFQLDIGEARRFCADAGLPNTSLESIFDWFRSRCTVVISLERFGAIGQLVGSDAPVAAWPYLLEQVVDSTGAGDAMGAGIMLAMLANPFDLEEDDAPTRAEKFAGALAFGRVCAAHACTTVGGAHDCPGLEKLQRFERREKLPAREEGRIRAVTPHELFLIDRAFDR
jgi:sugar/nucleoside kinase (ribokinase family)